MTNKKIWLSLLAVILVVCMSVGMLVSCSKTENNNGGDDKKPIEKKTTAITQLATGLQKAIDSVTNDFTDLSAGAKLDIELKKGSETTKYTVQANIIFDVLEKSDNYDANTAAAGSNKTKLEVEVLEGQNVVLGVYYYDQVQKDDNLVYEGNYVYLYENLDSNTPAHKYKFKAPFVKDTQRVKEAPIDFTEAEKGVNVASKINGVAGIIEGFLDNVKQSDTSCSFALNFDKVLNSSFVKDALGDDLAATVNGYMSTLGVNYTWNQIKDLLSRITINASASFDKDSKALTGIQLSLGLTKGNIEINKKNVSGNDAKLLYVGISDDLSATVKLDYVIGDTLFASKLASDGYNYNTYTYKKDILNVALSLDLDIDEAIKIDFGDIGMGVDIPAGQYKLSLAVMADPFSIIELINNGLSFEGAQNILKAIQDIIPLFDQLDIELYNRVTNENRLSVSLVKQYSDEDAYETAMTTPFEDGVSTDPGAENVRVFISTDIISRKNLNFTSGTDIAGILGIVIPMITGAEETANATTQLLQTIGGYLLGAYIGINDGTGLVNATFDTAKTTQKKIPFSDYTEFKGTTYNSDYTYYTKKAEYKTGVTYYKKVTTSTQFSGSAFDSKTTYYTKDGDEYKLSLDETPDPSKTYFYNLQDSYVVVDTAAESFDLNKTYYYEYDAYDLIDYEDSTKDNYFANINDAKAAKGKIYEYDANTGYVETKDTRFKTGDSKKYYTSHKAYAEMGNKADYFTFEEAEISEFAANTTYYVGPEFGITLSASLKLDDDKTNTIIEASVGGLDVIGLPATLSVKIGNLHFEMYEQNPDYCTTDGYVHVNSYNHDVF